MPGAHSIQRDFPQASMQVEHTVWPPIGEQASELQCYRHPGIQKLALASIKCSLDKKRWACSCIFATQLTLILLTIYLAKTKFYILKVKHFREKKNKSLGSSVFGAG